jgi:membrane-associated phospholipid phosphatase
LGNLRDRIPGSSIWKAYAYWSFWVTVSFSMVYPVCNWVATKHAVPLRIYFDWELAIPFVPDFMIGYASLLLVFYVPPFFLDVPGIRALGQRMIGATMLAGVLFLLLPAELGFARVAPSESVFFPVYEFIFVVDRPHNLVPSLHVIYTSLILLTAIAATKTLLTRLLLFLWLIVVCASTVLIHQHHVIDVASGIAIAAATSYTIRLREATITSIGSST